MASDEQILNRIKEGVRQTDPEAEIILYGSRARGNASIHADWDLLILLNTENITFDFERAFMDALYEVEIETGAVISAMIYSKKDWTENRSMTPLFENIQKEGLHIK